MVYRLEFKYPHSMFSIVVQLSVMLATRGVHQTILAW